MKRTKTQITDEILQQVKEHAAHGLSNREISQIMNIGVSTLSRNQKLKQVIQRGRAELSERIARDVLESFYDNPSLQVLLVKRLGLFQREINIPKPKDAKQALDNLATATKLYADNQISESQLKTIEAVSNSYIRGTQLTDIEERLQRIENTLNERIKP